MNMQKNCCEVYQMEGGNPLKGTTSIQGSKNASLPIMAASLLIPGESVLWNCPGISDLFCMEKLLTSVGCQIESHNNFVKIDASAISGIEFSQKEMAKMRSSIILLGAMLGRKGEAFVYYPGGCKLGERPIDLHFYALERLGVSFQKRQEYIHAYCKELMGNSIEFPFSSVGATQNAILTAVKAKGVTTIYRAAKEPEIIQLCEFLSLAGAKIKGAGTDTIYIEGVNELHSVVFQIPSDRIVAGTYLFSALGTHGKICLRQVPVDQMETVLQIMYKMGAKINIDHDMVEADCSGKIVNLPEISTMPYPGFPTDLQSSLLTTACVAEGKLILRDTIFEKRFAITEGLQRMGADIELKSGFVCITGKKGLVARNVIAKELRGGAALVEAGLIADGITTVSDIQYVERGYEDIVRDYQQLGGKIEKK